MVCSLAHTGGCQGPLEQHHVVPRQAIKKRFPYGAVRHAERPSWLLVPLDRSHSVPPGALVTTEWLLDEPDNLMWLCRRHHELVTNRRLYVDPEPHVWAFAEHLGLESVLEREQERAA